ncbi:MAG TPA: DUF4192 domain-containing protein [Mycobacteriales bacterium]|nr:DUF4192 domain-containing protein [Mycobacteriales bacterium]
MRSAGELAAALPHLCGFVPHESLVLISLRGPRQRVGLTMRVDLPPPEHEAALVRELVPRLVADGARAAITFVVTEEAGERPRAALADALRRGLRRAGIRSRDRVLLRDGRWWSYDCTDLRCCPPGGTPLSGAAESVQLVEARAALDGTAVLPSREALVASLAAPTDPALADRLAAASAARERRLRVEGRVRVGREALAHWRRALRRVLDREVTPSDPVADLHLGPAARAALVVSLADAVVRDEVLTWAIDDSEPLLSLLLELAGSSVPPHDAPVCALVGWVAHARGTGALANVALDRALASDPSYGLALLCRHALDSQVSPAAVKALLRDARGALHREHPWTAPAFR